MDILHLSGDYPDPLQPAKTKAIANLLSLVPEHTHWVYALNRVPKQLGTHALSFGDQNGTDHRAVAYGAPGRGWRHWTHLMRLAAWIGEDLARRGIRPALIHAHKLTIEGPVAAHLAERLGVPFVISVQGNTDLTILRYRPDLTARFRRVWQEAAVAFPFAPWAGAAVAARLGVRAGPVMALPCPGPADRMSAPRVVGPRLVTAFNFADAANKNAQALIAALGAARRGLPALGLEIIGGGAPAAFAAMAKAAAPLGAGAVRFAGGLPQSEIQARFNAAAGFAMVSKKESFGMVYAEALLAGCPCLISRGRGIDGYFEEGGVVLAADPGNGAEIAAGLERLARDEAAFKARLAALQSSGGLGFLQRAGVAETYRTALDGLTVTHA